MWKRATILAFAETAGLVAAATALASIVVSVTSLESVSAIYMMPVLAAAVRHGTGPAVMAALLGALMSTLFYPPLFSILVVKPPQIIDLLTSLMVALTLGRVAGRLRGEMVRARDNEHATRQLYELGSEIAGATDVEAIHGIVADHMASAFGRGVALFTLSGSTTPKSVRSSFSPEITQALAVKAAIFQAAFAKDGSAANEAAEIVDIPGQGHWLLFRLGDANPQAVLAVALEEYDDGVPDQISVQARSILAEGAKSLDRLGLSRALEERHLRQRTDALRDILVESVSHELRTPIAGILGSASVLSSAPQLAGKPRLLDLALAIENEARRLDLLIQNLLDITRIRSGTLQPSLEDADPSDIINGALDIAAERLRGRAVERAFGDDLPLVRVDSILIEQAMVNILENAAKFAPGGSTILISAGLNTSSAEGRTLAIEITDQGPGLDAREARQVFERFYRGERHADIAGGSGLGLTIAKIFAEASGGRIIAVSDGPGRGTTMRILLPLSEPSVFRGDDDD